MDNNLSRILYEVQNNIQWGNDAQGNSPPYNFEGFTHSLESAYTLGMNFVRYYERPAEIHQIRGEQAEFWYEFLGGISPVPPKRNKKNKFKWVLYAKKIRNRQFYS